MNRAGRLAARVALVLATATTFAVPSGADELGRARSLVDQRDYAAAIPIYDALVAAAPADSDLAIERARVLGFADRNAESARAYAAVANGFPARRNDVLDAWAWQTLWAGEAAASTPLFSELIGREPNDSDARLGLAQSLLHSGQEARAIPQFELALAAQPGSRDARIGLAYALNWSGESMAAARQFERVLPTDDEGVRLQAARAYYWAGFPDLALPLLAGSSLAEAARLAEYRVRRELVPFVAGTFDASHDSDHLDILTLGAVAGWRQADGDTWELSVRQQWLDGPDTTEPGNPHYSIDGLQALGTWTGRWGSVDAPYGVAWPMISLGVRDYDDWTTFAWRARVRWTPVDALTLTAYTGDGVLDTIGAIRNRIGYDQYSLSGEYRLDERWLVAADLTRFDIDRGNQRGRANLRVEYLALPSQRVRVGVEGMYFSDSDPTGPDQPDLGYWNPDHYAEERLYATLAGERGDWSWDGRASAGYYQERDGWGNSSSGAVFAAEGNAAYDFAPGLQLRFYAGGSTSGAGLNGGGAGYDRVWGGIALTGWFR